MVFTANSRSHGEKESAGNKVMPIIFKGNTYQTLNSLRHKWLIGKVATVKYFVKPETWPPTESATQCYSFQTYFQIMQWKVKSSLRAVDWGWTVKASKFIPVLTDLKAPFQSILKIIRCQCKTDCSSRRCGCQKNNLPCTYVYGSCLEKKTEETLKILVYFQMMKKTGVIMDPNTEQNQPWPCCLQKILT